MNLVTFMILLLSGCVMAQSFFPLAVNNKYQVFIRNVGSSIGGSTWNHSYYSQHSITEDTLINGAKFFRMNTVVAGIPFPDNPLLMYDTMNQKLFIKIHGDSTIRLAIDFNAPADSAYTSYLLGVPRLFRSGGTDYSVIYDTTLLVHKVSTTYDTQHLIIREFEFVENIGIYYSFYSERNSQYRNDYIYKLISAIVDSSVINPIILEIQDISPLVNRPVDTFPFSLTGTYYTNYNLVDNFSVEFIIERDGTNLYNWTQLFFNGTTTVYHYDLQPGDKLKLKATISDYSIYNNVDVFPDSGFAVIEILNPSSISNNYEPLEYHLGQNYPNPFNATTVIPFEIEEEAHVIVKIYNILGEEISLLLNEVKPAGKYKVKLDAGDFTSGIYFYKIMTEHYSETKKMVLLK